MLRRLTAIAVLLGSATVGVAPTTAHAALPTLTFYANGCSVPGTFGVPANGCGFVFTAVAVPTGTDSAHIEVLMTPTSNGYATAAGVGLGDVIVGFDGGYALGSVLRLTADVDGFDLVSGSLGCTVSADVAFSVVNGPAYLWRLRAGRGSAFSEADSTHVTADLESYVTEATLPTSLYVEHRTCGDRWTTADVDGNLVTSLHAKIDSLTATANGEFSRVDVGGGGSFSGAFDLTVYHDGTVDDAYLALGPGQYVSVTDFPSYVHLSSTRYATGTESEAFSVDVDHNGDNVDGTIQLRELGGTLSFADLVKTIRVSGSIKSGDGACGGSTDRHLSRLIVQGSNAPTGGSSLFYNAALDAMSVSVSATKVTTVNLDLDIDANKFMKDFHYAGQQGTFWAHITGSFKAKDYSCLEFRTLLDLDSPNGGLGHSFLELDVSARTLKQYANLARYTGCGTWPGYAGCAKWKVHIDVNWHNIDIAQETRFVLREKDGTYRVGTDNGDGTDDYTINEGQCKTQRFTITLDTLCALSS